MNEEKVLYEVKEQTAWITLNRPEALNAINEEMRQRIIAFCGQAQADQNVQVVLFHGAGEKAFTVGGDLKDGRGGGGVPFFTKNGRFLRFVRSRLQRTNLALARMLSCGWHGVESPRSGVASCRQQAAPSG